MPIKMYHSTKSDQRLLNVSISLTNTSLEDNYYSCDMQTFLLAIIAFESII